jgi:hypothetical protein
VQKLLGDRHTAEQNLAAARNENLRDPDAEASLASVNAQLAELGFE